MGGPGDGRSVQFETRANMPSTPSMTAVGVASVLIARWMLLPPSKRKALDPRSIPEVDRGLAWMRRHYTAYAPPNYYNLYSLERVGRLTASRQIALRFAQATGDANLRDAQALFPGARQLAVERLLEV